MAEYDAWATYYDLLFTGLAGEAEFYAGQALRVSGFVLELGCGTGRIAIPMALGGVHVIGVDNSAAMLARCQQKVDAIGAMPGRLDLVQGDMRHLPIRGPVVLAILAYRTFMHLLTPDEQRESLTGIWNVLAPGGRCMLNTWAARPTRLAPFLQQPGHLLQQAGRYELPGEGGCLIHSCTVDYDEFHQTIDELHFLHDIDDEGGVRAVVTLPMRRAWCYPREMAHLLERCGFEIEAVFGDFDCRPFDQASNEMIWVARKPNR